MVGIMSASLWLHATLMVNVLTHYDGEPEEPPVNGRYKVSKPNE